MSAYFYLKYRGQYVLLTFQTGKTIASLVERKKATPFISEANAWLAASQHGLNPEFCEVENPSETKAEEVVA